MLPISASSSSTARGFVWTKENNSIKAVINSRYYLITGIGAGRSKSSKQSRITVSKSKFYKSLFQASKGGLSDPQLLSHLHKGMREKAAKQQNKS